MKNVINIDDYRPNSGADAHAAGNAFALTRFSFDDDAVGTLPEGGDAPASVVIVTDPSGLTGFFMSKEDAFSLARALSFAAGQLK